MKTIVSVGIQSGCGVTTSTMLLAMSMAKHTHIPIGYVTTGDSYKDVMNMFGIKPNEDPLRSPQQLVNLVDANQLKKEDVDLYVTKVEGVDLIPLYNKDIDTISLVSELFKVLTDYAIVFVDVGSTADKEETVQLLEIADLVLFNTTQRKKHLEQSKRIVQILDIDKKTMFMLGKFDPNVGDYKTYAKFLRTKFAITSRIPYNYNFVKMEGSYKVLVERLIKEYEGYYGLRAPIKDGAKSLIQLSLGELNWEE